RELDELLVGRAGRALSGRRRRPSRSASQPASPAGDGPDARQSQRRFRSGGRDLGFLQGQDAMTAPAGRLIRVTPAISLDERELEERFIRASGPGGQNVNKLSSAVQLRFDVRRSPSLPDDVRVRLERLAGRRLTREGVLVITAQRHRTQERNRQDALARLIELIRQAAVAPIPRRATKPTRGSRERRLESKRRRASIKGLRQGKPALE